MSKTYCPRCGRGLKNPEDKPKITWGGKDLPAHRSCEKQWRTAWMRAIYD